MNALMPNSQQTMSSIEVAQLTGKRHDNVMADCGKLLEYYQSIYSPEKSGQLIQSSTYKDASGKSNKCYQLGKDAALDLVTGYSLPHRHAVNKRWIELEAKAATPSSLSPANLTRLQLLEMAMQSEQERLLLEAKVTEIQPKADALDRIATGSEGSFNITNTAKTLQMRPKDLFAWLSANHWIYRRAGGKVWVAYQDRIQSGLLEHKITTVERSDGTEKVVEQVLVTPRGLAKLSMLINPQPDMPVNRSGNRNGLVMMQGAQA